MLAGLLMALPLAAQQASPARAPEGDTVPPARAPLALGTAGSDTVPVFRAELVNPADTTAQPVVVELRIGRLAQRTVAAYRVRTEALVPLTQLLQMAEILFRLSPEGRLEAVLDPDRGPLVVDARSDTMAYGRRRLRIEPEFKRYVDGELYVGAERLGDLLDQRVIVDWSELMVVVVDPSALPIGRRLQREAAREAFLRRRAGAPVERVMGMDRRRWGGLVLDYSLFLPSAAPLGGGAYTVTLGADAFGGSLEAAALSHRGIEAGAVRLEGTWSGVWRDRRWLTQLSVGDAFTTGPRLRQAQGVTITNSPYIRPSLVGAYRYGGRLEPGWVIEAYRGGQLIAFDSTDGAGRFGLELPSFYGENPVDFVAYGPFGETRRFNQTYRVLSQLLPAGRFEYGAAVGACRSTLCDATANLDVRYGLSRRWAARGGLEQMWRDTLADLTQPYLALTGTPLHALAVEVEGLARGFIRGGVNIEPSLNLRIAGDVTLYDDGVPRPALTPQGRLREWGVVGFVRPVPRLGWLYVDGSVRHTGGAHGGLTHARLGVSYQAAALRLLPYVRMERTAPARAAAVTRSYGGVNVFVLPRPWWGNFWGGLWARGDVELEEGHGLRAATGVLGRDLLDGVRLEVGGRYQREFGGTSLVATLQTYLPGARSVTTVDAPPGGAASGSFQLHGSALYNETARRVAFAPGPAIQRAGLTGRVFVDENANGAWDSGEEPMGGVRVRVGNQSAVSDSSGAFRVWELIPFEPTLLVVDTLSVESPLIVPAFATASVTPSPNRFRAVDVPLVRSAVVEGRAWLETAAGARGLAGASVLLTNRATGLRQAVMTFSDGGFYFLGVRPGDYDLAVDTRVLDAFGAVAGPLRLQVAPDGRVVGPPLIELRAIQR